MTDIYEDDSDQWADRRKLSEIAKFEVPIPSEEDKWAAIFADTSLWPRLPIERYAKMLAAQKHIEEIEDFRAAWREAQSGDTLSWEEFEREMESEDDETNPPLQD
jgi:hypothetical protein